MSYNNPYSVRRVEHMVKTKASSGDLRKEISASQSDLFMGMKLEKYNPDTLVGKKGLEIYKKMKDDDQVKASLTIKKFARLSTPWTIVPGDEASPQSVEMAEFVNYNLKKLPGTFERSLLDILSAIEYGYSVSEKVFGIIRSGQFAGRIGLMKLKTREPFGYNFVTDAHGNIEGLTFEGSGLAGNEMGTADNPYPPDKFVIYSYNSEQGNPFGTSDLRPAYRAWWSKGINIQFWNIFNERFGSPTIMAKYPAKGFGKDKKAISEIDDILKNLQAKSGFRIPDNYSFELLEAQRQGVATYGDAVKAFDMMIARAILVPSLLGFNAQEKTGSFALGKKHFDVFMFVLEMMGRDIEETIVGDQIIRPLVMMNYGDVAPELTPRFQFESLEDEDTKARAEIIKMLADSGLMDKREDWVREYLMLPERDLDKYPHATEVGKVNSPVSIDIKDSTEDKTKPDTVKNPGKTGEDALNEDPDDTTKKMKLDREPNKFEEKVKFQELDNELNAIGESLIDALTPVILKWKSDLTKKAQKILDTNDTKEVNKLKFRNLAEFRNTLRDYFIKTHLDAKLHALEELQTTGYPVEIKRKFSAFVKTFAVEPWEPLPPSEAIAYFNKKVVAKVELSGQKKILVLGKLAETAIYSQRAFTITGVESEYILNQAKNALLTGLKNQTPKQTMTALEGIFTKYLASGELKDGKLVSASRLETIVRTNSTEALNQGRMTMFRDPDVDSFVPFIMWSAILDSRTTNYCQHMDGKIFRKTAVAPPPAHFNCRSVITPVTKVEVDRAGGVKVDDWDKQSGIGGRAEGFDMDITDGIIEKCPYSGCFSSNIKLTKTVDGNKYYECLDCGGKFMMDKKGKLFLWAPQEQRYIPTWREFDMDVREGIQEKCPYTGCYSKNIALEKTVDENKYYICNECNGKFMRDEKGKLYLYSPQEERYIPTWREFAFIPIDIMDPNETSVRCIFPACGSDVEMVSINEGTKTYRCPECYGKFRVTPSGDVFVYEPGDESWKRITRRIV